MIDKVKTLTTVYFFPDDAQTIQDKLYKFDKLIGDDETEGDIFALMAHTNLVECLITQIDDEEIYIPSEFKCILEACCFEKLDRCLLVNVIVGDDEDFRTILYLTQDLNFKDKCDQRCLVLIQYIPACMLVFNDNSIKIYNERNLDPGPCDLSYPIITSLPEYTSYIDWTQTTTSLHQYFSRYKLYTSEIDASFSFLFDSLPIGQSIPADVTLVYKWLLTFINSRKYSQRHGTYNPTFTGTRLKLYNLLALHQIMPRDYQIIPIKIKCFEDYLENLNISLTSDDQELPNEDSTPINIQTPKPLPTDSINYNISTNILDNKNTTDIIKHNISQPTLNHNTMSVHLQPFTDTVLNDTIQIPTQHVPAQNLPNENVPNENLPDENLPDENVPNENLPDENLPDENLPDENVLDENVLDENVLDENVLDENVLDENVLDENVVDENVVDENVVDENVLDQNNPERWSTNLSDELSTNNRWFTYRSPIYNEVSNNNDDKLDQNYPRDSHIVCENYKNCISSVYSSQNDKQCTQYKNYSIEMTDQYCYDDPSWPSDTISILCKSMPNNIWISDVDLLFAIYSSGTLYQYDPIYKKCRSTKDHNKKIADILSILYKTIPTDNRWPPDKPSISENNNIEILYTNVPKDTRWPPDKPSISEDNNIETLYMSVPKDRRWPPDKSSISANDNIETLYMSVPKDKRWPPDRSSISKENKNNMEILYMSIPKDKRWPPDKEASTKENNNMEKLYMSIPKDKRWPPDKKASTKENDNMEKLYMSIPKDKRWPPDKEASTKENKNMEKLYMSIPKDKRWPPDKEECDFVLSNVVAMLYKNVPQDTRWPPDKDIRNSVISNMLSILYKSVPKNKKWPPDKDILSEKYRNKIAMLYQNLPKDKRWPPDKCKL